MRHDSERSVVNRVQLVLIEDEDVDVWTLRERALVQLGQVVTTQLDVAKRRRKTAGNHRQSALGDVDVRQSRRRVEMKALELGERVSSQHEVEQSFEVTHGASLDAVDAVVREEEVAQSGQVAERELGQRRQIVVPQVQSAPHK